MTSQTKTTLDNRFTQAFGAPKDRAVNKMKVSLPPRAKEFIAQSPFMVMATSDPGGNCDASPKGGKPGFVKMLDDRRLFIPDVAGNKLFQSYINMDANPHVGLVFFIPGKNDTLRINGRVRIVDKGEVDQQKVELSINNPDDNSKVLQGVIVEIEEAYAHCPRSLNFGDLWDVEQIRRNGATSTSFFSNVAEMT